QCLRRHGGHGLRVDRPRHGDGPGRAAGGDHRRGATPAGRRHHHRGRGMNRDELRMALETALTGRRLLSHPFYRRWVRGELTVDDLRGYAEQYRCFEASLPVTLGRVRDGISDGAVRAIVQGNLDDETGAEGISHLELFDRFM